MAVLNDRTRLTGLLAPTIHPTPHYGGEPGILLSKEDAPMTTIYLIRHAQADGNLYRRCQAWYDSLVSQTGYQQIEALEARFRDTHFDAVYSSDLFRTMTTAKAIYKSHNLPLYTDPDLREINSGCWEDKPWGELLQTDRECLLAFWRCDPSWQVDGSETFQDIQQRFDAAVRRIASTHPSQTVAVFAHGCIIRATLALWLGLPPDRIHEIPHGDNTSVAKLEVENGTVHVCWYNDIAHLPESLAHAPHPSAESDEATARGIEKSSIYFAPFDLPNAQSIYLNARRNAWKTSHGTMEGFDGNAFLDAATACYNHSQDSILTALLGEKPVGILQMDFQADAELNVGRIPFLYIEPEIRDQGLGVQLLGQAVSAFRALDRQYVRLRCAPENTHAQIFYKKYGFYKIGEEPGGIGHLDTLEKYIGTDSH